MVTCPLCGREDVEISMSSASSGPTWFTMHRHIWRNVEGQMFDRDLNKGFRVVCPMSDQEVFHGYG